jgi:hypothetical protein
LGNNVPYKRGNTNNPILDEDDEVSGESNYYIQEKHSSQFLESPVLGESKEEEEE